VQGLLRDRKTISRQRPGNATILYKPSSDMRLQDLGCSRGLKRVTQESQQGGLCDVRLACLCAWITWPCMRKGGYGTAENNPAQPIHPAVFETISLPYSPTNIIGYPLTYCYLISHSIRALTHCYPIPP